jgi:hypothetical protein
MKVITSRLIVIDIWMLSSAITTSPIRLRGSDSHAFSVF